MYKISDTKNIYIYIYIVVVKVLYNCGIPNMFN